MLPVLRDLQVLKVRQALRDQPEQQVLKARVEPTGLMEFLLIRFGSIWEIPALNPHSSHRSLVPKDQQVQQELRVLKVRQDLMEQMERQVLPVPRVLQDQLG